MPRGHCRFGTRESWRRTVGTAARPVCLKPLSRTLNMVNLALRVFCFNKTLRLVASEGCAGEHRFGGRSGGQGRGAARGLSSERPGLYSQLCQGLGQVITEVSVSSSALGSKLNRSLDSGGRTRISLGFLNCVILSPRDAGPCLGTSVAVMTGVLPASSGCGPRTLLDPAEPRMAPQSHLAPASPAPCGRGSVQETRANLRRQPEDQ